MKNILVCDDDFIMIKLIENKLKSENYEVALANDGKKAIELLQKNTYDLVITDMHMPHATGMELIDFIRNDIKSSVPVIVLTKDTSNATNEDAYEIGADEFLLKPVNLNILLVKVKKLLKT